MSEPFWLEALVGHELKVLDKDGKEKVVPTSALKGNFIGLYFSAHWCPPCRAFTPTLVAQYERLKTDGIPFEIIFVSNDKKKEEFLEYFAEMPWSAVPFEAQQLPRALMHKHGIMGIPCLVMYDKDGRLIIKDAVSNIRRGDVFPWQQPPVAFNWKDILPLLITIASALAWYLYKYLSRWLRANGYIS